MGDSRRLADFPLFSSDGTDFPHGRFQGGSVSTAGHIYIASDEKVMGRGVYGFDLVTGRQRVYLDVSDGVGGGPYDSYELEGLCVFNLNGVPNANGQIHVGKIQLDVVDNLSLYHFTTPPGEEGLV